MLQQWGFALLAIAVGFLAIGTAIYTTLKRPPMWSACVFWALSLLMLVGYLYIWQLDMVVTTTVPPTTGGTSGTGGRDPNLWAYWLAGGGTSALALATVYVEIIKPRWNRPKFSLEFENTEPYCRVTTLELPQLQPPPKYTSAYFLRVKVTNAGKSVARRCIGKLVEVADESANVLSGYDPWALHWVGTKVDEIPLSSIDLNQKEYEYLDVLHTREDNPGLAIICKDNSPRGLDPWFKPGIYILKITVYGDNVKPETRKYRLVWGATDHKDIKLEAV